MNYSVKVQKIKITAPTKAVTGLSSYEDIVAKKASLFSKLDDKGLIALYAKIHGDKLTNSPIADLPKEEKRKACINALTFQLELVQEIDRVGGSGDTTSSNALSHFLVGRSNTTSSTGTKWFWQVTTYQFIQENGFKTDTNVTEHFANQNMVFYLLRTHSFKANLNKDGMITNAPKRNVKGGNVLTLDGKLIFQDVSVVIRPSEDVEAELEEIAEMELENAKEFIADGYIDATDVPTEMKQGDIYNIEFQDWLQNEYASRNLAMMTSVA